MRNTWWVPRPKRQLTTVPLCLTALANSAEGKVWKSSDKSIELEYEHSLEVAQLKARGDRRDQGGGGARTYRAWMKSLGLVFMDADGRLQLTCAGEALAEGQAPLPILKNQVLNYQFPASFTSKGSSAVENRFTVRPFVFILQLLRDPRLDGFLDQFDDVGKIAVCYGESNSDDCVDDVVQKILEHRSYGDDSLEPGYLDRFASSRSNEASRDRLFANLNDISNTIANWLGYTQLITRIKGRWHITEGAESEVDEIIRASRAKPLITDPEDEVKFQRRYGLRPGQKKDTRRLGGGRSVTSESVRSREINIAFLGEAARRVIMKIDAPLITKIADQVGAPRAEVDRALSSMYPNGAVGTFMHSYAQMAFDSRAKATDFEIATASIFQDVFGFEAKHIGQKGRVPDVVISSKESHFGAILDSKAYAKGYSIGIGQQNRMRDYIRDFSKYALSDAPLAFFSYIVADYKSTVDAQIQEMQEENSVSGSAITARDIIRMVERHESEPYSHFEVRSILSIGRAVTYEDLGISR